MRGTKSARASPIRRWAWGSERRGHELGVGPERRCHDPRVPPELPLPDPPLTGAQVVLRPWTPEDADDLLAAADDALVLRYRASAADIVEDPAGFVAAAEAARVAGERLELAICPRSGLGPSRPVGSVSLWGVHRRNRDAMVSWWLGAAGRGRGLGSAAVTILARWAFDEVGLERLGASIEEDNAPSRRLAERCGFQLEGRLRSFQRLADGTRVDCLSLSVLPGELRRLG